MTLEAWEAVASSTIGLSCTHHARGTWDYNPAVCTEKARCEGVCYWEGSGARCNGGIQEFPSPIARRICPCQGLQEMTKKETGAGLLDSMDSTPTRGTMSLVVTTSNGDGVDLKLKMHKVAVIEMALQAHFGYNSVNVLSLHVTSARRLLEASVSSNYQIDATFEGRGSVQQINNGQTLLEQVQASFDANEIGIRVKSASVSFDSPQPGQTEEPLDASERDSFIEYALALGAGLVSGALVLFVAIHHKKNLAHKKHVEEIATVTGNVSMYPDSAKATESKEAKKEEDLENVSVSTAPPTDSDSCSEIDAAMHAATNNSETPVCERAITTAALASTQ